MSRQEPGTGGDVVAGDRVVRRELKAYSPELAKKKEIVALSKCDALDDGTLAERFEELNNHPDWSFYGRDFPPFHEIMEALYDVVGRRVLTRTVSRAAAGDGAEFFNASKLPAGVYFVRLTAPRGEMVTRKFVVIR